jgi:FlaG/FlaF family flagellin (archaellin)
MADLTIDAQDVRTRGAIFLDLVSGYFEPSNVRGVDTVIPASDGRVVRNRVVDDRTIRLEGYVQGSSASNWNSNTAALFTALDPTSTHTLTIGTGYLGVASPKTITVRFVNAVGGQIVAQTYQPWNIELESVDPEWA